MPPRPALPALLDAVVAAIPGGRSRPGQHEMAAAVAAALREGHHLLVQAGTGTGKSVAYAVPALLHSGPVVIATATKALQSQLVTRDLPRIVDAAAPLLGHSPAIAILKGRANYLCRLSLEKGLVAEPDGNQLELDDEGVASDASAIGRQVVELRGWAKDTETGDRDDVPFPVHRRAWAQVSVSSLECIGRERCPLGETCFAEAAKDAAAEADVVVTNHALLALDAANGGAVLPKHGAVIVDEAHELIAQFTSAAATELTLPMADRAAKTASRHVSEVNAERLAEGVADLKGALEAATPGRYAEGLPAALDLAVRALSAAASSAAQDLANAAATLDGEDPGLVSARQVVVALRDAADVLAGSDTATVRWLEVSERQRKLVAAPLDVAATIGDALFGTRTVIATSATLTSSDGFTGLASRWGLDREPPPVESSADDDADPATDEAVRPPRPWRHADVGSPFDYAQQAVLYVAEALPPPKGSGISPEGLDELLALVTAAGGRALGLFSSWGAAEAATEFVRANSNFTVRLQGEDTLKALVAQFRDEPRTCLFGVRSLWQGVDAPGATCQLVVIDRLPFAPPDDPLVSARIDAAGGDYAGWARVQVPAAGLLLAQAAGRLLRSETDRGVVAVLDSRLRSKGYGHQLLRALPPFAVVRDREKVLAALRRIDTN